MGTDDSLLRDHPDQKKLPLMEAVDRNTGEIRDVVNA